MRDDHVPEYTGPRDRTQRAVERPDHDSDLTPAGNTDAEAHLENVVRFLASALVDEPDAVEVTSRSREHSVYLNLRVGDGELGKVIGRQGRTARAIRTAVQIAGARHDVRASLDIEG
ncbi:MAG TPA: KH domain-containing protein [Thermomicrobiales bacterium]|jgi:hypothetical protein|nr:KH domain-containing protein [Thermomicrobiales bacterium]